MYKCKCVVFSVFLMIFLLSFPSVFAQSTSRDDALFIIEKVTQQNEIQMQREMGKATEILNNNIDANYAQLDGRIKVMYSQLVRKLVIGLVGGFSIVLVGYAWLVSYTTRKYTPIFQRNLLKGKYGKMIREGRMVTDDPFLNDVGLASDARADMKAPAPAMEVVREPTYEYDFAAFNYDIYDKSKIVILPSGESSVRTSSRIKSFFGYFFSYLKVMFLILFVVVIIAGISLFFKINLFKYVGITIPFLGA